MTERVPLFLYGTLRPGQRLHYMVAQDVEFLFPAIADGRLYHHVYRRQAQFPVARFDEEGAIYGDLAVVRFTTAIRDMIHMELSSGYDAKDVTVRVQADNFDDYTGAIGFHFPGRVGQRIPTGDWLDTPEAIEVIRQSTEGDNDLALQ